MTRHFHIGISTCPNDTFAFHALLERCIPTPGIELTFELLDVQELNERLARDDFDVAKASFHAALHLGERRVVLPVGAALGFGVGPILLSRIPGDHPSIPRADGRAARVLCPGAWTTATLLYRLFHAADGAVDQVVFSAIIPALRRGGADFGVCIHEGRFTYREAGLHLVEDLGATWETRTRSAIPLGCLLGRKDLRTLLPAIVDAIRRSIDYAYDHRQEALETMRRYAAELDDAALWKHVELYVNAWTRDLRPQRRAVDALADAARGIGMTTGSLEILDC